MSVAYAMPPRVIDTLGTPRAATLFHRSALPKRVMPFCRVNGVLVSSWADRSQPPARLVALSMKLAPRNATLPLM